MLDNEAQRAITSLNQKMPVSFVEQLRAICTAAPSDDLWSAALDGVTGRVEKDCEYVSTEWLWELLDVPAVKRTPELASRLRTEMVRRRWVPCRRRHATSKGYAARIRGYVRMIADRPSRDSEH
jgi:hypothetical protein